MNTDSSSAAAASAGRSSARFLIVTAEAPQHRFVTRCLVDALGTQLAGVVVEQGSNAGSTVASIHKGLKRYGVAVTAERITTKLYRRLTGQSARARRAIDRILGDVPPMDTLCNGVPLRRCPSVNGAAAMSFIRDASPDYLLVYGTGVVRDTVLSLARHKALNLHTGLSPHYRGSATGFWALYYGEPAMVGATVHECTSALDGGAIYCRVCAALEPGDDEHDAFARSVRVGARHYADLVRRLAEGQDVDTVEQDLSVGREFRFTDKTFLHELRLRIEALSGRLDRRITEASMQPLPYPPSVADDEVLRR